MKFIPILFSTPMVQAILDGRKSQTRMICKIQSDHEPVTSLDGKEKKGWIAHPDAGTWKGKFIKCPYGEPGDVLWVREGFFHYGHWHYHDGKREWVESGYLMGQKIVRYLEDAPNDSDIVKKGKFGYRRVHSPFMPKWACRIWLLVKSVRVERLQDISEEDSIKEGIYSFPDPLFNEMRYRDYLNANSDWRDPRSSLESLWESINGAGSWHANPWVWVIEFERLTEEPEGF